MKHLANYIDHLNFEYAISCSGLRGIEFTKYQQENSKKIDVINRKIKRATNSDERNRLMREREILPNDSTIHANQAISNNGKLHPFTQLIHEFKSIDEQLKKIFDILHINFEKEELWMCAPIYRDAIVFYSKEHTLVGILHVCFSCGLMKNEQDEIFQTDFKIFPLLKQELIKLGHKIED